MADPKIEEAKKWCEDARKLLNFASLPGTERWTMGTRVEEVGKALETLKTTAKSPDYVNKFEVMLDEYAALGERAKEAAKTKDEAEIKKISGEIKVLADRVKVVAKEISDAKANFLLIKASAVKQLTDFKAKFPILSDLAAAHQKIVDDAQKEFEDEFFVEAVASLDSFAANLFTEKKQSVTAFVQQGGVDPLAAFKIQAAFTSDPNKLANLAECQTFIDELTALSVQAQADLTADRLVSALSLSLDVYGRCTKFTKIVEEHALYVARRVDIQSKITALPTDSAALKKALADKLIVDYQALWNAAKVKGGKHQHAPANGLLDKASTGVTAAEKIIQDEIRCQALVKTLKEEIDKLPAESPVAKPELVKLRELLAQATEKQTAGDIAEAEAIATRATEKVSEVAGLAKGQADYSVAATQAGGGEDFTKAVEALRVLWEQLRTRTPEALPKLIVTELGQIDTKLKAVTAEIEKAAVIS